MAEEIDFQIQWPQEAKVSTSVLKKHVPPLKIIAHTVVSQVHLQSSAQARLHDSTLAITSAKFDLLGTHNPLLSSAHAQRFTAIKMSVCLSVCHSQDLGEGTIMTLQTSINAKHITF